MSTIFHRYSFSSFFSCRITVSYTNRYHPAGVFSGDDNKLHKTCYLLICAIDAKFMRLKKFDLAKRSALGRMTPTRRAIGRFSSKPGIGVARGAMGGVAQLLSFGGDEAYYLSCSCSGHRTADRQRRVRKDRIRRRSCCVTVRGNGPHLTSEAPSGRLIKEYRGRPIVPPMFPPLLVIVSSSYS